MEFFVHPCGFGVALNSWKPINFDSVVSDILFWKCLGCFTFIKITFRNWLWFWAFRSGLTFRQNQSSQIYCIIHPILSCPFDITDNQLLLIIFSKRTYTRLMYIALWNSLRVFSTNINLTHGRLGLGPDCWHWKKYLYHKWGESHNYRKQWFSIVVASFSLSTISNACVIFSTRYPFRL